MRPDSFGTVIRLLNEVKGGGGLGSARRPLPPLHRLLFHHFSVFDDQPLVPFFPAMHFERDLLEFRQFAKLDDVVTIQLHLVVLELSVFFKYRQAQVLKRGRRSSPILQGINDCQNCRLECRRKFGPDCDYSRQFRTKLA